MKREGNKFQTEKVLVLVLFAVLAVCVILVLLTGAGVYGRLTERGQAAYERRTVPQYIATKIRQADCEGAVSVSRIEDTDTLQLTERIDEKRYLTRIYCYEGFVREFFSAEDVVFEPAAGEKLMEAEQMCFSLEDGSLLVTVRQRNGVMTEQRLTLRSAGEEVFYEE